MFQSFYFQQVVDRKTLDVYNEEEAKWGRSPNDPFTGKLYSETSRSVETFENLAKHFEIYVVIKPEIQLNIWDKLITEVWILQQLSFHKYFPAVKTYKYTGEKC